MSFTFLNQLPTPAQIKEEYPLSKELTELKAKRDAMISDVICGKDDRFLVIIGPCSADNEDSVCDYVSRLTKIQEDVKDRVIIIPRVYTNKPRTTGEGYKGIASQPDPEKAPDMVEGLIAMRKMHIRAIAESGLTCADEMLYPENWGYVEAKKRSLYIDPKRDIPTLFTDDAEAIVRAIEHDDFDHAAYQAFIRRNVAIPEHGSCTARVVEHVFDLIAAR